MFRKNDVTDVSMATMAYNTLKFSQNLFEKHTQLPALFFTQ